MIREYMYSKLSWTKTGFSGTYDSKRFNDYDKFLKQIKISTKTARPETRSLQLWCFLFILEERGGTQVINLLL